jgi:thymidylate synthase (FAD)
MANILSSGHNSVLEHASATFYITGVSRALTHQLVRHRHFSFSELSQRFVDVGDQKMVIPPALRYVGNDLDYLSTMMAESYEDIVGALHDRGLTRKQAREAARAVLPGHWETKIVVTGNHRAWREMISKRATLHADAEICELAVALFKSLSLVAPNIYQDGWVQVHEAGRETVAWGPLE